MNQVVEIFAQRRGGTRIVNRELSPLPHDCIRVAMEAFSLNHRDLHIARGRAGWEIPLPRVPLSDGVGVVTEIGSAVRNLAIGDRVASLFWPHWQSGAFKQEVTGSLGGGTYDGVLQTQWQTQESSVIRAPNYLTAQEAACLPCAGLTAWCSVRHGKIGDRVLIHGSGTVALFATQFARALGMEVTMTSRSPNKRERLEAIGTHFVHLYSGQDWSSTLKAGNFDLVIDPVGGDTLIQSLQALRIGGTLVTLGQLGGSQCQIDTNIIWEKGLTIASATVGSREDFAEMNRALEVWKTRPVIAATRAFTDYEQVLDELELSAHVGKLTLVTS